jgi:hypothetical protein
MPYKPMGMIIFINAFLLCGNCGLVYRVDLVKVGRSSLKGRYGLRSPSSRFYLVKIVWDGVIWFDKCEADILSNHFVILLY